MDFETIIAMISFAALIIVWAFAPSQSALETSEATASVAAKAVA
jgi:hypothetical protein